MKKGKPEDMKQTMTFLMVFIALIACGLMLLCPEVTLVFGSSKYYEAVRAIPPIAASVYFIFLYSILSFPQFYFERTSFLSVASFVAAGLNIVLNIIFVPVFGYIAAAYTTLACYALYSLGHWIISKRILKKNNMPEYVNSKAILIISVTLTTISVLMVRIIEYRLIRFSLVAAIVAFFAMNYKKMIKLLQSVKQEDMN